MARNITIHQPEHLPWLGFFHKMAQADLFVILDTVQFEKNNWQNRNKLIDREGSPFWVTVPVNIKGHLESTINDIRIDNNQAWQRKYWGRVQASYCRHPYFQLYANQLESILYHSYERLVDLNLALIDFFRTALNIITPLMKASELCVTGKRSDLLLDICLKTNATSYLSGPSGKDYLNRDVFKEHNVDLNFHDFSHPTYEAPHFVPYLSTIDLIMNHGEKSAQILGLPSKT